MIFVYNLNIWINENRNFMHLRISKSISHSWNGRIMQKWKLMKYKFIAKHDLYFIKKGCLVYNNHLKFQDFFKDIFFKIR